MNDAATTDFGFGLLAPARAAPDWTAPLPAGNLLAAMGLAIMAITGLALVRLRRQRPSLPRPYRVVGYPWVPALFVVAMTGLVLNTLYERPLQSLLGVGLVALGVPVFRWLRARTALGSGVQFTDDLSGIRTRRRRQHPDKADARPPPSVSS
jgi:hypothetical protein